MKDLTDFISAANTEPLQEIVGKTTGNIFQVRHYTYGVLVPDENHPLSCVSVSNNSISIDLWIGCSWQCRYCHVQGTFQDLMENGTMPKNPIKRSKFSINQIIDSLLEHPFFTPHKSIISIGTASTEPFANGVVCDSTFEIMNAFVERGLTNPFWIVTKNGIPKGRKKAFTKITRSNKVMISLCWAGNSRLIEPAQNNRFANIEEAKESGVTVAWYMRPITPEWGGSLENIEMMMLLVKEKYGTLIDMIVPGGLRWTEGIENGLVEIHKLPMPNIPKDDNLKSLPQELIDNIFMLGNKLFPNTPIYLKSSCALTHMIGVSSINAVQVFCESQCEASICTLKQRSICCDTSVYRMNKVVAQQILDDLGIPAEVKSWDLVNGIKTSPSLQEFSHAIRQTVFKHLAMESK